MLPARTRAFFDPSTRKVSCLIHHAVSGPGSSDKISARAFADTARDGYRNQVRAKWGPFASLVLLFRPDNLDVRLAEKGAAGEEKLGALLDKWAAKSNGSLRVLHDRSIPGRRENMDHIVVSSNGVWAVDAKSYAGRIDVRSDSLTVGRRDQEKLLRQMSRQQSFLTESFTQLSLPNLPVHTALCFLDPDISMWHNGKQSGGGVYVCGPRKLRKLLTREGALTVDQVEWTANKLSRYFTSSTHPVR